MAFVCKTATLGPELQVSMGPDLTYVFFCIQNSDFSTRIASLYGSQPSSVVLCIHNSIYMTRINSLYGSHTAPVVLCLQNNVISTRKTSLSGSQPSSVVFACKTTPLGPEYQVSRGHCLHLWFLLAKQRLLDQNYKSLCVPGFACSFVHEKQLA